MLEMILYSISIMYTPGPVTITAAQIGMRKQLKNSFPFFISISVAIFALYILFGYFGSLIYNAKYIWILSLVGGIYMIYLSIKMIHTQIYSKKTISSKNLTDNTNMNIGFKEGFIMQFFNPKAIIAVMPVITIYFPLYQITGIKILFSAIFFMILVFGSPLLYAFIGQSFSNVFKNDMLMTGFIILMSLILTYTGFSTLYHYVFLAGPLFNYFLFHSVSITAVLSSFSSIFAVHS